MVPETTPEVGEDSLMDDRAGVSVQTGAEALLVGLKACGVATSSMRCLAQMPSLSRKVSRPDSREIPAPVRTTMRPSAP